MADKALNRRRGLRRQAEETPVENLEVEEEYGDEEAESEHGLTERKGRATRGRRTQEVEVAKSEGNFITRPLRSIAEYFEGVRSEMAKVVWPSREDTRRLTLIVLGTTISSALILGILSLVFSELFVFGIRNPIVFGVLIVVVIGAFVYYLRQSNRRTTSF